MQQCPDAIWSGRPHDISHFDILPWHHADFSQEKLVFHTCSVDPPSRLHRTELKWPYTIHLWDLIQTPEVSVYMVEEEYLYCKAPCIVDIYWVYRYIPFYRASWGIKQLGALHPEGTINYQISGSIFSVFEGVGSMGLVWSRRSIKTKYIQTSHTYIHIQMYSIYIYTYLYTCLKEVVYVFQGITLVNA